MGAADRLPATAAQIARDRRRLRASEAAVVSDVIEFQLARQRIGAATPELVEPLSRREREVLVLLAAGLADGQIAERLFISKKTASVHVANIKAKLGASSRVEIAMLAARLGPVDSGHPMGTLPMPAGGRSARVVCPFKGLACFDVADAPYFFGRERVVGELVAGLAGSTFLGVIGPSGSGKSSVVRAGLVPALASGVLPGSSDWPFAIVRPGERPGRRIREAAADLIRRAGATPPAVEEAASLLDAIPGGRRIVLVVDQFEEVFTICSDPGERAAAIRHLVALGRDPESRVLVVLAVRADFYGRCADERELGELLGASHVLVGPMTAEELAHAVELPTRAARLRVEPQLTSRLVADVLDRPGGLPLLSTALLDLWQRRDGRVLRLDTYERIGGVSGAVARLAEAAYERLTPAQQEIARAMLLRLSTFGDGDIVLRRPTPLVELEAKGSPDASRILGVLTEHRLLTVDEGVIEISHEALLHDWPRLGEWLEADREGRRLREHLGRAAREWHASGRDDAELYRGARLAATLDWATSHLLEANELEREFLAASRTGAEREIVRERRTSERLRWLLIGTIVLLTVAIAASGLAAIQLGRSDQLAARAEQEALRAAAEASRAAAEAARAGREARMARSRELAASALATLDDDPSLSKLLALEAASIADPPLEAIATLHQAWAEDRIVARHAWVGPWDDGILESWTDLDPAGDVLVRSGLSHEVASPGLEVVDLATDTVRWSHRAPAGSAVGRSYVVRDGTQVLTGMFASGADPVPSRDEVGVLAFDTVTGDLVDRFDTGACGATVTSVAGDLVLALVALPSEDDPPCLFKPERGWRLVLIDRTSGTQHDLATGALNDPTLSGDGRFVAFDVTHPADEEHPFRSRVVHLDSGRVVLEFDPAETSEALGYVRRLNHDGSLLLYGDRPIQVYDVASRQVVAKFRGHAGESFHAEFTDAGDTVYSTGRDLTLRHWNARTGVEVSVIAGIGSGRPKLFADDSQVLVADFQAPRASVVERRARGEVAAVATCRGFVGAGAFDVAGNRAALLEVCDTDAEFIGATQLIDITAGTVETIRGFEGQTLAISPDGTRFVHHAGGSFPDIGPIVIRDLLTGAEILPLQGTCTWNWFIAPRESTSPCRRFPETPFPMWLQRVAWSPDGAQIAGIDDLNADAYVGIWNAIDGRFIEGIRGSNGDKAFDAIYTPDARRLIVSYFESGRIDAYSTETWNLISSVETEPSLPDRDRLEFIGFSPDGSTLLAVGGMLGNGGGSLHWFEATTLAPARSPVDGAHEGSPKAADVSPDGSLLATGASGDPIRIWDTATGELMHEIPVGDVQVQGVAFVTDGHLAVVPEAGSVFVYTLDGDELLELVRASLTRGFTATECARFDFEPCPTLEEMAAG